MGVLTASGNTLYGMERDCNDAWNIISTAVPTVAGTYTTLDANGRGTGIITLGETNANITFYAVSSSQLLMVNAVTVPIASGEWDQQSAPAGGEALRRHRSLATWFSILMGSAWGAPRRPSPWKRPPPMEAVRSRSHSTRIARVRCKLPVLSRAPMRSSPAGG